MKRCVVPFPPNHMLCILSIALCMLFAGCKANEPLRLGFMAGISGRGADIGMAARDAVQLSVEQCDTQGGIRGRQVTLIIKDDQQRAEAAVKAVPALIDERVAAIVGPMSSAIAVAISNWAATQRLIELGGRAVEGVTVPIALDWNSPAPAYQQFRKIYVDRYNREPGFPGFYAYNAAQVVLAALKAQRPSQSLKETILSIVHSTGCRVKSALIHTAMSNHPRRLSG